MRLKSSLILAAMVLIVDGCGAGREEVHPARGPIRAHRPSEPAPTATASATRDTPRRWAKLVEQDFVEGAGSRDPFRRYLGLPPPPGPPRPGPQVPCKLKDHSLDTIALVAVLSGAGVRSRAMFRSPGGRSVVLRRGEHLSSSFARLKTIFSDRVVVQLRVAPDRATGAGNAERVIEIQRRSVSTRR